MLIPWFPLIVFLIVSLPSLYLAVSICGIRKPVLYKTVLAAIVPWIVLVTATTILEYSPYYGCGPCALWFGVFGVVMHSMILLFLAWKYLELTFWRSVLAVITHGALLILGLSIIVFILRFSENN